MIPIERLGFPAHFNHLPLLLLDFLDLLLEFHDGVDTFEVGGNLREADQVDERRQLKLCIADLLEEDIPEENKETPGNGGEELEVVTGEDVEAAASQAVPASTRPPTTTGTATSKRAS